VSESTDPGVRSGNAGWTRTAVRIGREGRKPVIADVARLAGVSVPTVSRVLTGNIPVSEELRQRVLGAIGELDYRPSSLARNLRTGERRMIAILTSSTERYGYARVIAGVEREAQAHGYSVVISAVRSAGAEDIQAALTPALDEQVAGVLVIDFDPAGAELLKRIPQGVPAVAASGFSKGQPGFPYAFIDEYAAGLEATRFLLGLGHPTVHHLGLYPLTQFSGRYEGWLDALREAGLEPPPVLAATFDPRSGYEQGLRIAEDRSITAVFCSNDVLAHAALRALHDRDLDVPADVSLIGWDNQPFTEFTLPALTTVEPGHEELGGRAFRLLLERMSSPGGDVADTTAAPALVRRESTAPPPARP